MSQPCGRSAREHGFVENNDEVDIDDEFEDIEEEDFAEGSDSDSK